MDILLKIFMQSFDRFYMHLKKSEKYCMLDKKPDLFDGKEYTIDEFYKHYSSCFDAPCEFYKDFLTEGIPDLKDGIHPRDMQPAKVPLRKMIFRSPISTDWPNENDIVPFKWLRNKNALSNTILLFVPGWGRTTQSHEEKWSDLLRNHGVDVGIVTKPYHQARAPKGTISGEYWISQNMFWTIANFRHLVAELRILIQYMRNYYKHVGLIGMSSGGFQAALASNCEDVDFFFPIITGSVLGSITWNGMITQWIRKQLEKKGVNEASLNKIWSICDEATLGKHCKAKIKKQYMSMYDEVVPTVNQMALWEAIGKPPKMELPCAHYSFFFYGNKVFRDIAKVVKANT